MKGYSQQMSVLLSAHSTIYLSFIFRLRALVPVRFLTLPTFPQSLKLFSVLVFSPTLCFPHCELCHCYLFCLVPSFEHQTIPAQIAYADSDLSGMNQISTHSLLVLARFLHQLSAGYAVTARSLRNGKCKSRHSTGHYC